MRFLHYISMRTWAVLSLTLFSLTSLSSALAEAPSSLKLWAETLEHDHELETIIAKGNVEVGYDQHILLADTLSYNQKTGLLTANGNVSLARPNGEVVFADYMTLTDDMKEGVIERMEALLNGNIRVSAHRATRTAPEGNTVDTMHEALYSPCKLCKDNPEKAPFWQLKVKKIIHDEQAHNLEFHNARLEFFGVPVIGIPYFSHPDWTVRRKSGFLAPQYGYTDNMGTFLRVPYFWAIADDRDITFSPIGTKEHGLIVAGEYRQAFRNGDFRFGGSVASSASTKTTASGEVVHTNTLRGHVDTEAYFDTDKAWKWGFHINRVSDKTYFSDFDFSNQNVDMLVSTGYLEKISQRRYAAVTMRNFQDLRTDIRRNNSPNIMPFAQYNHVGEADSQGGRWHWNTSFRELYQDDQSRSERFSTTLGYEIPFTAKAGHITTLTTDLRMDVYNTDHKTQSDPLNRPQKNGTEARFHPQLTLDWRYPFFRPLESGTQIIEPIVAIFAAPKGDNPADIRNDDSPVLEEGDLTLFTPNRFPGLDRIEGGMRAAYGLKGAHYFAGDRKIEIFLGQTYRLTKDRNLAEESKIKDGASGYIGVVELMPTPHVNLNYRFLLNRKDTESNMNAAQFTVGPSSLKLSGTYIVIDDFNRISGADLNQLNMGLTAKLDENWSVGVSTLRNLDDSGMDGLPSGTLKNGLSLTYDNECFTFISAFTRSNIQKTGTGTNDTIFLTLVFKTLGRVDI